MTPELEEPHQSSGSAVKKRIIGVKPGKFVKVVASWGFPFSSCYLAIYWLSPRTNSGS